MSDQYFIINIRAYLDKDKPTYIGENSLYELLSDFSCPSNPDVEYFLLHNAIEFTKKDQSITYLVFSANDASLVGYFSLAIKPISIRTATISKTMAKKLSRVSILDKETNAYTQWRITPTSPTIKIHLKRSPIHSPPPWVIIILTTIFYRKEDSHEPSRLLHLRTICPHGKHLSPHGAFL